MGIAPGRLHFHVQELLRANLIELTSEVPRGGIIEKYYRASATHYRLDMPLAEVSGDHMALLDASVEVAREEYTRAVQHYQGMPPQLMIVQDVARLDEEDVRRINELLSEIVQEMHKGNTVDTQKGGAHSFSLFGVFHRTPSRED